jgi:hypothetical protein
MLPVSQPTSAGTSSSTAQLHANVVQALSTPEGMTRALNGLFGSSRVLHDPASGCWLVPNARTPGTTLIVAPDGRTLEIGAAS